jgi:glycosyltransferase involved in cell wall biosynthesis
MEGEYMKKILVVCDFYYPDATAIGVCAHKVAKNLCDRGNEVHVLCFGSKKDRNITEYEGIKVHHITKRIEDRLSDYAGSHKNLTGKLARLLSILKIRIWQIIWFPFFRMASILVPLRFYSKINKLYEYYSYDMIISTYNPFEGMLAGYWFRKKHPNVLFVLYILDTLSNAGSTKWISSALNEKMGWRWEKRIFPHCDTVINLRCHEQHHQKKKYDSFRDKMVFTDIPLFQPEMKTGITKNGLFETDFIHFTYAGRVLSEISNPAGLLMLFEKLCIKHNYKLHFFSSGDCEHIISEYERKTDRKIMREGLVPHEKIKDILQSSDVLVSIGNSRSEKITSKIFEYISTGKPCLHIQRSEEDTAVPYYQKYPRALIIKESDSIEENIKKITDFLNKPGKEINMLELKKHFIENTPEFTGDLVMNLVNEKNRVVGEIN